MNFEYEINSFIPYESIDYLYENKLQPEFGAVNSSLVRELEGWKFYKAENHRVVPFGSEAPSFDDSDWDIINVPSTWQTEGYGLPSNLLYNYSMELESIAKRGEESILDKYILHSTNEENDEIGIYRTVVVFSPEDIDRALYLEVSGIVGSFELYLNGKLIANSHSIFGTKKLLISDYAKTGVNTIVIFLNRWDRDSNGRIIKGNQSFGFAGIFRPIKIVAEPLLEMSDIKITLEEVPKAYSEGLIIEGAGSSLSTNINSSSKDYSVKASLRLRNHLELPIGYQIKVALIEAKNEYDTYNLPYSRISLISEAKGEIDKLTNKEDSFEIVAFDVNEWTDGTPHLYDLLLTLQDSQGKTICVKRQRIGFRTTSIIADKLTINDRTIPLMAVKYFEFDPFHGICVPSERYKQDMILLKKCGLNTIITQGFIPSDTLLNYCDHYGIYVIANAEMADIIDFINAGINHPSLIMWSFAEFGFKEKDAIRIKEEGKKIDPTRPWYIEKGTSVGLSDISSFPSDAGIIFGPWQDLCLDRATIKAKNKSGKGIFDGIPGRGHSKDDDAEYKWIHHADLTNEKFKENSSIGQGIVDATREPHPIFHDIKKQCQSIVIFSAPDDITSLTLRNIHPFSYTPELILEWKVMMGGNVLMKGSGLISEIEPYGQRVMRFPKNILKFLTNGWADGNTELIDIYMHSLSHELVFDLSLKQSKNSYYDVQGSEFAFYQEVISPCCANPIAIQDDNVSKITASSIKDTNDSNAISEEPLVSEELIKVEDELEGTVVRLADSEIEQEIERTIDAITNAPSKESGLDVIDKDFTITSDPKGLYIGNDFFKFSFSRETGAITGIRIYDKEFLAGSLIPSFYRCPSNIDRTDRSFILAKTIFSQETDYESVQNSFKLKSFNYSQDNNVFYLTSRYSSFAMKKDLVINYEISSCTTLKITISFTPRYDLIRYGFRVPIVKDGILCSWYGRGPGESYYDRKNATKLGLFMAGVDKIYHPYARPSENSNHTDTEVVELSSGVSKLRIMRPSSRRFDFTVLPFTPEQMNDYLHDEQLMTNDNCELFLDFVTKEIERTLDNTTSLPLRKGVNYCETFEFKLLKD